MKKFAMRFMTIVMAAIMLVSVLFAPIEAKAAVSSTDARYNIMLVIDGSGSLQAMKNGNTDPKGMRFEMMGDLFGVLEDDGHCLGAIVFSGNESGDTSDSAMLSGIKLDTGFFSLDERAPGNKDVKDYLLDQIEGVNVTGEKILATDVGTALLYAEEQLEAKCAENGLPGMIFLFTDGATEFNPKVTGDPYGHKRMEVSLENRNEAAERIYQNGNRLFGVFLNSGGKSSSKEVKQLVLDANGISENSNEFQNSYVEITDANSAHNAVNVFMRFLGFNSQNPVLYYDDFTETFTIPGVGVDEMNIRLFSSDGGNLPNLKVTITQPDGSVITGVPLRSSRTFRVYKLVDPMPGEWTLSVTVPENNSVGFYYDPVMNLGVDAAVNSAPAAATLHTNMDVEFTANLVKNGVILTDSGSYRGYECSLVLTNVGTGAVETIVVAPNAANEYRHTLSLDTYGTFDVQAVFSCGKIVVASPPLTIDLTNKAPVSVGQAKLNVLYGLFQSKETVVDLAQYVTDPEDGTNLSYSVKGTTCNESGFTISGTSMTVINKAIGDGSLVLIATDSQGGTAELQLDINAQSATLKYLLIILAVIALIVLIIVIKTIMDNNTIPEGDLFVRFECKIDGKDREINLELDVPGANAESKTSLGKLMRSALRDDTARIDRNLYAEDVKQALENDLGELGKVGISKTTKKRGKKKHGAILVKHGSKKQVLFGSSTQLYINDNIFTLDYVLPESGGENPFDMDDYDAKPSKSGGRGKKKKDETDPFEDLF